MSANASIVLLRRSFLVSVGLAATGLALGWVEDAHAGTPPPASPWPATTLPADGLKPNVFVHIATSGAVTIVCHRSEMGQGITSSLPVLIADELGANMKRVTILQGDGDAAYGDQNTDGSRSVRTIYQDMRKAGATARVMLIAAAAKRWRVPPTECVAREHQVLHEKSKRALPFGDLVEEARKLAVPAAKDVALRPTAELEHIGKPLPLLDGPGVVTGKAAYGADVVLPGMLTAVIARPPVVGGKLIKFDGAKALAIKGVKKLVELTAPVGSPAFQPRGGVAVVAEDTWSAMKGRAALELFWDHGPNASYDSTQYKKQLSESVRKPGRSVRNFGDADAELAKSKRIIEAEYHVPHLAHAAMEPLVCVAKVEKDSCEVWAPTQNPQASKKELARALGMDAAKITVHVTKLGGGFGRKSKQDFVAEAALVSRAMGAPVRVQWTRADDIQHDYFHTVSTQLLRASLAADGKVTAWHHRTAFPPIPSTFDATQKSPSNGELGQGVTDLPLDVPNVRAEACEAPAHVRIGWLRSVCNIFHGFAVGSFIDELAQAKKVDTKTALLELLGPARVETPSTLGVKKIENYGMSTDIHPIDVGRMRNVVERVAKISSWANRQAEGKSLGMACHRSFNACVAVVVSVVSHPRRGFAVDEAWLVVDAGTVINPDRVRSQMEGAVVFGMSIAMHSSITMKAGVPEQSNFHDYRLIRMPETPKRITVDIIPSSAPPGGIGEPGVPPVAAAIANAVFALTGVRHRELPIPVG